MKSLAFFIVAAIAELAGCYAYWLWLRKGHHWSWALAGLPVLALFAFALTRGEAAFAGRTYAAYGGIYIAAAILWLWWIEAVRPDRWDLIGAAVCLAGTSIILFGPRSVPT